MANVETGAKDKATPEKPLSFLGKGWNIVLPRGMTWRSTSMMALSDGIVLTGLIGTTIKGGDIGDIAKAGSFGIISLAYRTWFLTEPSK